MQNQQLINSGKAHVTEAIRLDNDGKYKDAFDQYELGLKYLVSGLKQTDSSTRALMMPKVQSYMARAEELKNYLKSANSAAPISSQDSAFFTNKPLLISSPKPEAAVPKDMKGISSGNVKYQAKESLDKDYLLAVALQKEEEKGRQIERQQSSAAGSKMTGVISGSGLFTSRATTSSGMNSSQSKSSSQAKPSSPAPTKMDLNSCPTCNQSVFPPCVTAMGRKYHSNCLYCDACEKTINGSFIPHGDPPKPYHQECHRELFHPKCSVCNCHLPSTYLLANQMLEPYAVGFCISHKDSSRRCFACHRYEPPPSTGRELFTILPDKRTLCSECVSTVILDSEELQPLYQSVITFMQNSLHLPIPPGMREVPVLAVDLPSLNEQSAKPTVGSHGGTTATSIVRGVTLSTVSEVRCITPGSVQKNQHGQWVQAPPTIRRVEQIRDVTAVLVLYGLPRNLTASILAHEAMHVWFKLTKNIPSDLPSIVEEGMCELISSCYLNDTSTVRATSEGWDEAMRKYLLTELETNTSPVYGEGFRRAAACYNQIGLDILIEYIRDTKSFPNIIVSK